LKFASKIFRAVRSWLWYFVDVALATHSKEQWEAPLPNCLLTFRSVFTRSWLSQHLN